jgi:hypothetical protein
LVSRVAFSLSMKYILIAVGIVIGSSPAWGIIVAIGVNEGWDIAGAFIACVAAGLTLIGAGAYLLDKGLRA